MNDQVNETDNTEAQEVATQESAVNSKQVVIEVPNPTAEEIQGISEHIEANYNSKVTAKPVIFNFKKSVDKDTGIETIRKPVQLVIPYPSVEGIVEILQTGGKGLELLLEAVESIVNARARDELYDDVNLNASTFPVNKLAWEAIANIPKVQRRGGGIPKEVWADFAQDYVEVMPAATGKDVEQVGRAAKLLLNKLVSVRTNKPVLDLLVQQLAVYAEHSPNAGEYAECIEFLLGKADTFLNVSSEELLANL